MELPQLKIPFIIALLFSLIFLTAWELHWRSKSDNYVARIDDDRYLWAEHRAKVETATSKDVIIIGSSRTGFNFNTHVWKEAQGIEPINLSTDGKPPGPFLVDIVENTNFNGTLVIGVTPLMFFGSKENSRWADANLWVKHYQNQTYAQKFNFYVSKPLQRNLVMLTSSELNFYNDLDLKSLINTIPLKGRTDDNFELYNFKANDENRNLIMLSLMTTDPSFAKKIYDVWNGFIPNLPSYEAVADKMPAIFDYYLELINKFRDRGGKIIFVRHKAEEGWNVGTKRLLPRDKVWDPFIEMVDCPAYHFEDYEFMSKHTLPDWSHMSAESASIYTRDIVSKMIEDEHLTSHK